MITFPQLAPNWQAKYLSTMALVFRNISLACAKDSSSSPLIAIRFCVFLKKLNKPKGAGLDGISSRLILDCADLIAPQISILFNSSLANGIFPDDWKSARVTPLFKHGERSDIDNYRQVSVISIIGKVFERIIYNQLFAYLSDHNILSKHQSGFRTLHSTVATLLEATDSWAYNIDIGNVNAVVKKHHILLSKLHRYVLTGVSHKWFSFYLDNRTQKCVVNDSLSECCTFKCGIPQATILGLNCVCHISMICPIVCLALCQECMLMLPIWLIRMVISTPFNCASVSAHSSLSLCWACPDAELPPG